MCFNCNNELYMNVTMSWIFLNGNPAVFFSVNLNIKSAVIELFYKSPVLATFTV